MNQSQQIMDILKVAEAGLNYAQTMAKKSGGESDNTGADAKPAPDAGTSAKKVPGQKQLQVADTNMNQQNTAYSVNSNPYLEQSQVVTAQDRYFDGIVKVCMECNLDPMELIKYAQKPAHMSQAAYDKVMKSKGGQKLMQQQQEFTKNRAATETEAAGKGFMQGLGQGATNLVAGGARALSWLNPMKQLGLASEPVSNFIGGMFGTSGQNVRNFIDPMGQWGKRNWQSNSQVSANMANQPATGTAASAAMNPTSAPRPAAPTAPTAPNAPNANQGQFRNAGTTAPNAPVTQQPTGGGVRPYNAYASAARNVFTNPPGPTGNTTGPTNYFL